MDHKDCLILTTLREVKTLTKTSQRLFISQPALTYRLQNLEKELGVPLVIRTNAGVMFTQQGNLLCDYAEETLNRWNKVLREMKNFALEIKGTISLGVSSSIAQRRMSPLLKGFQTSHPFITIDLHVGSSALLLPKMLETGKVDIAIIRGEVSSHIDHEVIDEEPLGIISSSPIKLEELAAQSWIRYLPANKTTTEKKYEKWWKENFTNPHEKIVRVDSIEAALQMVSYNLGWCIAPKLHVRPHSHLSFTPIIMKNGQQIIRKTSLAFKSGYRSVPLCKIFVDYIMQHYHKVR